MTSQLETDLLYVKLVAQLLSICCSGFVAARHILQIVVVRRAAAAARSAAAGTPPILESQLPVRRQTSRQPSNTNRNDAVRGTAASLHAIATSYDVAHGINTTSNVTTNASTESEQHVVIDNVSRSRSDIRTRTSQAVAAGGASPSTRILRASCFCDLAYSTTGAVATLLKVYRPDLSSNLQVILWTQAPHWCLQVAAFMWMAILALYIAKKNRAAMFDVTIAHAVVWLIVGLYYVLEIYATYYQGLAYVNAAKIIWKFIACGSFSTVCVCWFNFARRRREQQADMRRRAKGGAYVLSKLLLYTISFLIFVSPDIIVDLSRGLQSDNIAMKFCSALLALWPIANAWIYLTKSTPCICLFRDGNNAHTPHSNQSRMMASTRASQMLLMSPSSHALKGLEVGEKIGEGIAVVHLGTWRGANVAVKMKSLMLESNDDMKEFQHACNLEIQKEAQVMKTLSHPNIVLFMEAGFYKGSICIISEYCARGSLRDVLKRANVKHLSWPTKLRLALGISHGVQYLHNANPPMIHRDLKSPNVLVDDSWHAKIADFGTLRFSEIVSSVQHTQRTKEHQMEMTGLVGTTRWMAPEVIRGDKIYTSKVDIYSLALIFWELIEGQLPFESTRWNTEIEKLVLAGKRPVIRADLCPLRWKLLIVTCWHANPQERPTIQQVINSLQRIAREETWDTTAPRFTGAGSQFSATQSSYFEPSLASSASSFSLLESPPSKAETRRNQKRNKKAHRLGKTMEDRELSMGSSRSSDASIHSTNVEFSPGGTSSFITVNI